MHTFQSIIASAPKRATPEPLRSTKAVLAICAVLLPVFCFGDIRTRIKYFERVGSSNVVYSQVSYIRDVDALHDAYFAHRFGLLMYNSSVVSPCSSVYSSWYNTILNDQISVLSDNVYTNSPYDFPRVFSLYTTATSLILNGYSGAGIDFIKNVSGRMCYNIYFPDVVANVFASTNSLYRQIVLSHLSTISGTLVNIGSSVGTINNDYRTVNDPYLNPSYTNIAARAAYFNGLGGLGLDLEHYLPDNPDQAPEIAKAVLENARRNVGYVLNACRDPDSPFYGSKFEDIVNSPDDFEKAIFAGGGGSVLSQFVNDSQRARQAGENFNKGINDRLDGITSALVGSQGSDAPSIMGLLGGGGAGSGGIAGDIKRLSTNDWVSAVTNQLAENTADTTNRLAQNTRDIKDALANMFGSVTNDVRESSDIIKDELPGFHTTLTGIGDAVYANGTTMGNIQSHLENGVVKVDIVGADIGFHVDSPLEVDAVQWEGISMPLSEIEGRLQEWHENWKRFYNFDDSLYHWKEYYDMVARIEASITNSVPTTNDWQRYYFDRFKQADNFLDKDKQSFKIDDACDLIFGNGFDIGEYDKLNWFSRVEVLLYKFSSVTNILDTTDITFITNEVNTLNFNVTNFVNTSVKVVGVFKLIDGFAKSMRSAFSGYSSPQTSGVVLLEAGHWIGDEALVLKVPVEVQNALRLVFECIWYLSAFVVAWRILVWSWDKIVSMVRWLWSLIDI